MMPHFRAKLVLFVLASLLFLGVHATSVRAYTPPATVTVTMYRLISPSGALYQPLQLCSTGNTEFGCTAVSSRAYPYANNNPVTLPIEADYLLDVVPQELGTYYDPTALQAQAIAARTYAYWHIRDGSAINNSVAFQAFIPYRFESLNPAADPDNASDPCISTNLNADQQLVCNAVALRYYVSYEVPPDNDIPAFTEFSSDVVGRTASGSQSYLRAVDDPISAACDANNYGHYRGMSQEGASRWARGHQCSYEGAPTLPGNAPGTVWSVAWEHVEQILVHYYTGIQVRDADNNNAQVNFSYRWNPLRINWGTPNNLPPAMVHNNSYPIGIQVQNTGISDWTCIYPVSSYSLRYRWSKTGHADVVSSNTAPLCGLAKGDPSQTVNLTINDIPNWGPGAYALRFDMYVSSASGNFWFTSYNNWFSYDVSLCVDGLCKASLPLILKQPAPTPTVCPGC
ncbi:MAG: hypothetical protein HY870_06780 [Chloroflexi bacterium]|nr:hypothetical protein [Chloroflexota bacterium]